jgi:ribosomal protein L37AE/L43A
MTFPCEEIYDYNDIICPVCGYKQQDTWELPDDGEIECAKCGTELSYSSNPSRNITTQIKGGYGVTYAPWTREIVDDLEIFQRDCADGYICRACYDLLRPTLDGWICDKCGCTQNYVINTALALVRVLKLQTKVGE